MAQWLTIAQAAHCVHKREDYVRRAVKSGALKSYTPPDQDTPTLIHPDDLDDWVKSGWRPGLCQNAALRMRAMMPEGGETR